MSAWFSACIMVPVALADNANRAAVALGHDGAELPGRTFLARVSDDGSEPASHVLCRTQCRRSFLDQMEAAAQDSLPVRDWAGAGILATDAADVTKAAVMDARSWADVKAMGGTGAHVRAFLAAQGKRVIKFTA